MFCSPNLRALDHDPAYTPDHDQVPVTLVQPVSICYQVIVSVTSSCPQTCLTQLSNYVDPCNSVVKLHIVTLYVIWGLRHKSSSTAWEGPEEKKNAWISKSMILLFKGF